MLLTIQNLPGHFTYANIKSLLLEKCGLTKLILDELVALGNTQQVTVGLRDEGDAAVLVRKINGLFLNGQYLHVKDVNKTKAAEQPFHSTNSYQHGNQFMGSHDENPYMAASQSIAVNQSTFMNQPGAMLNMMQYNATMEQHQTLDRNTTMTQNTMMVQGDGKSVDMQYAAAITQEQMQMAAMNYNMSQNYLMGYNTDMQHIPGMTHQATPYTENNSQFGSRQNVGSFDNDDQGRNGSDSRRKRKRSRQRDRRRMAADYDGRRARSPPRDTSDKSERYSGEQSRSFDQQGPANAHNIRVTFENTTENAISNFASQPSGDYQQPFGTNYTFNSIEQLNRLSSFRSSNNFVEHGADKNFAKRYKSSNRSPTPNNQFEDQGNESFENAQREYGNTQDFSEAYEYHRTPQNFGENKIWQEHTQDRSVSEENFVNQNFPRNDSFVRNAGHQTQNRSKWNVPYKANDDRRPNYQPRENQANNSFARSDGPPKTEGRRGSSRWGEPLTNQAKFAHEEKSQQRNNNTETRMKNSVPKPNTRSVRKDFIASTKQGNSAGFAGNNYPAGIPNEKKRKNALNKDETVRGQAAAGLSRKLMSKFFKPEMLDKGKIKKFLVQLRKCIRLRIDVVMGTELAKTSEEIVRAYGSIFHMSKDKTFFFAVFEKFMNESAPECQEVNDKDPLMIEAKKLMKKAPVDHDSPPAALPTGVKKTKSFKVLRRLTEKEFDKGALKLSEMQEQVLNKELAEVTEQIVESLKTENPEEEPMIKKLKENSVDSIVRALRKEVTKRILNVSDGLGVRVFCKPSLPRKDQLQRVLKSYNVVNIKKPDKGRMFWAHLQNWKDYDRLINTQFAVLDGITFTFKAPDMTNLGSKPTRDHLVQFRKKLALKQIDYMEEKLKLDFNIESEKLEEKGSEAKYDTKTDNVDSVDGNKADINNPDTPATKDEVVEPMIDCDAIVKDCDDVIIEENPEHEAIHEVPDSDDKIEENDDKDVESGGNDNESTSPQGPRIEMFGSDQMLVLDECKDDDDFDPDHFIEELNVNDIGVDDLEDY